MKDSDETETLTLDHLKALAKEVKRYQFAEREKIDWVDFRACGCMGPTPECRCMRQGRLVKEALNAVQAMED